MDQSKIGKESRIGSTVRISIPAKVAYDIGALHKMLDNLAQTLGCNPCVSGADCTIHLIRDYLVDPESLQLKENLAVGGALEG